MRLHRLTLTGIGPFRHEQTIDFDDLTASGLFLIEGPTGAGKSTVIDAIVFALYGTTSGAESDLARVRSHLCAPDEPSRVVLEFSIGGVRHTIARTPKYDRLKKDGSGTRPVPAGQVLEVHDGHMPGMREAKEIGVYLQQRLGLSAEQFRRLVVLPQGEFDRLLKAKARERYEMLASLIDDGAKEIRLVNRSRERAEALACMAPEIRVVDWSLRHEALGSASLLVNATNQGMIGQPALDLRLDDLPRTAMVNDLVYVPLETPLLANARLRGNPTVNGLEMLLNQAIPAFEAWFGVRPSISESLRQEVLASF